VLAQGDGNAEVGDAVEEVHRAVDGIDDPMEGAGLIAGDAFLAVDGVIGKLIEDHAGDEFLGLDVELELDVVGFERIDVERGAEVGAQKGAGGACGGDGEIERVHG
jgi:hypothetical protein